MASAAPRPARRRAPKHPLDCMVWSSIGTDTVSTRRVAIATRGDPLSVLFGLHRVASLAVATPTTAGLRPAGQWSERARDRRGKSGSHGCNTSSRRTVFRLSPLMAQLSEGRRDAGHALAPRVAETIGDEGEVTGDEGLSARTEEERFVGPPSPSVRRQQSARPPKDRFRRSERFAKHCWPDCYSETA